MKVFTPGNETLIFFEKNFFMFATLTQQGELRSSF